MEQVTLSPAIPLAMSMRSADVRVARFLIKLHIGSPVKGFFQNIEERTKTFFVFVFVYILVDEQAIFLTRHAQ